jgi:hypothetical protein
MNPIFINDLLVMGYLIFGTFSIAMTMGWALNKFGALPQTSATGSKSRPLRQTFIATIVSHDLGDVSIQPHIFRIVRTPCCIFGCARPPMPARQYLVVVG